MILRVKSYHESHPLILFIVIKCLITFLHRKRYYYFGWFSTFFTVILEKHLNNIFSYIRVRELNFLHSLQATATELRCLLVRVERMTDPVTVQMNNFTTLQIASDHHFTIYVHRKIN